MNIYLEVLLYGLSLGLLGVAIIRINGFIMNYDFHVKRMPWSEEE